MDSSIFLGGSAVAAFVAGVIALFAPCCISVMLPAYFRRLVPEPRRPHRHDVPLRRGGGFPTLAVFRRDVTVFLGVCLPQQAVIARLLAAFVQGEPVRPPVPEAVAALPHLLRV